MENKSAFEEGYEEGRKCGKPGVPRDDSAKTRDENPYPVGTSSHEQWDRGWKAANDGW